MEFISTHCCEIFQNDESKEKAKKLLSKEELERIFSSDKLKIESEDWLFELICSLGPEFYSLFDYIEIQYLSVEKVKQLIEIIDNEEINIHNLLWSSICRRLLIDPYINNEMKNPRVKNVDIQCEQGIFKYLSEINNVSNIYSSKIIGVKSSQINHGEIENLFEQINAEENSEDVIKNSILYSKYFDEKFNGFLYRHSGVYLDWIFSFAGRGFAGLYWKTGI